MTLQQKLEILTDSAKYDVACTSSGLQKTGDGTGIGNALSAGICHSFSADGRCITLLKVLMTNSCIYNCKYCVNRIQNDLPRATFTPRELADLTIQFYRRNYIEGLFLSSGILKNPNYTIERMIETLRILREEYHFFGYIHAKAIPGANPLLLTKLGLLADRMSVNIELPSEQSLQLLAPDKAKTSILKPMAFIRSQIDEQPEGMLQRHRQAVFAPAGQSTQMIIGATPDTDYQILRLSEGLYQKYRLKRVFFSAYIPVSNHPDLPAPIGYKPPLLREHRLYQADWLLRFYGYRADEILDPDHQSFHPLLDPKANWAIQHPEYFPLEVNTADYQMLVRVPGIGVTGAKRICIARRAGKLDYPGLKKMGIVLKRAQYFILCQGKRIEGLRVSEDSALRALVSQQGIQWARDQLPAEQLSFFQHGSHTLPEVSKWSLTNPQ